LRPPERYLILYNKPEGEIVTRADPEGRELVFDRLPRLDSGRWIAIGRLDANTSGLLLFTTDGELANQLMHPASELEREYLVRVLGEVTPEMVRQLLSGVQLEDGPAHFEQVHPLEPGSLRTETEEAGSANRWFRVVLREGRKREVRRLWETVGARVSRLKRIRFGPLQLDAKVRVGQWRELTAQERNHLLQAVGLSDSGDWASLTPKPRDRAARRQAPSPRQGQRRGAPRRG